MSVIMQGLLAKGIGDIISAAVDVITNNPADINEYLKSSTISIGALIVTAGVLSFINGVFTGGLSVLNKITAPSSWGSVVNAAIKQTTITAVMSLVV